MKHASAKILTLILLSLFFPQFVLEAQNLTGIWRGYFISDGGDQYKLEFQISQNRSNIVSGVSYSYLDVRFYGKATMTGSFIRSSSSFRIREIKTVEVKSILGGTTCIMNYNFVYTKSGKEEFLDGVYLGKYESRDSTLPSPKWGDCGGGKVYLRKVPTSDFYIEPFLRNKIKNNNPIIDNEAPIKNNIPKASAPANKTPSHNNTTTNKKPVISNPTAKNNKPVIKAPVTKNNSVNNNPIVSTPIEINKDTIKKIISPLSNNSIPKQIVPAPEILKTRKNELVKTLVVYDPDVIVKLYDNGEIDGDTISVYMDNKLVLDSKGLTASPLILKFKMDEDNSEHELIMVAENMGRIPPNTSLMIVESGDQRFDVRITSTEQKNALVKFKYQKQN